MAKRKPANDPDNPTDARTPTTEKVQRFVELFVICPHATRAYQEAFGVQYGTAKTNGSRLLRMPKVLDAIEAAKIARVSRTQVDQDYVVRRLQIVHDTCAQLVEDEKHPGVYRMLDARGAAQALGELEKHLPKTPAPSWNINLDYASLTDAQLEHIANGGDPATMPKSEPTPAVAS